jgi:hypothetical protein
MIDITCYPSGDRAEADSPEAAVVAARTLCQDDLDANPYRGRDRSVVFHFEDGTGFTVRERDLWTVAL